MQIFFVIDKVEGVKEKIDLLSKVFDAEFKFFVSTKNYLKINTDQFILEHLAGVYEDNINKKIDEYIKGDKFRLSDVLLYYSSAELTYNTLKSVKDKIGYNYTSIYLKKKTNKLFDVLESIYKKVIGWMFREEDALGFVKTQYISADFMQSLIDSRFNNHILKPQNTTTLIIEDKKELDSLKMGFRFEKYNVLNAIAFISFLAIYIVITNLFKVMFWVHFMFITLLLMTIVLSVMLIVNNIFSIRYRKK